MVCHMTSQMWHEMVGRKEVGSSIGANENMIVCLPLIQIHSYTAWTDLERCSLKMFIKKQKEFLSNHIELAFTPLN